MHADGGGGSAPCGRPSTQKLEPTDVIWSLSHAKKQAFFTGISPLDGIKSESFSSI